jgi:pimeloyl-ACP methyl ester carboxylesterase
MKKSGILAFGVVLSVCMAVLSAKAEWIENAQHEKIYVQTDGLENARNHKLAVIQHGLASNKEHQAVQTAKKAFEANGYTVILFDSRHSLGEGDNDVEKVSLATFEEDLETVTAWAKTQPFYSEPFALSGHSLGGASVLKYAAEYPDRVNVLIPISPVLSGQLWEKTCLENLSPFCEEWQKNGSYEYIDPKNHKKAVIPYRVITASQDYDARQIAPKIKATTLLVAAQNDQVVNATDVRQLATFLPNAAVATVAGSTHNFETFRNQADLYRDIDAFLKSL